MSNIRHNITVFAVFISFLGLSRVQAGGPLFPCCHKPCVKKCCNECGDIIVHVCPPKGCAAPQRTSNESGTRGASNRVFFESGVRPAIVQSVPQFAFSPMMAMPMVSPVTYQQPQRISNEAGTRNDRCYATCDQLKNIDEKIEKLSGQMTTITNQIGAHTLLIKDLMDRMDDKDAAAHTTEDDAPETP